MVEVLYSKIDYNFLDQPSRNEIESLRKEFSVFKIKDLSSQCPLQSKEKNLQLFTFTGTRINRTIQLLLDISGIKNNLDDDSSSFFIQVSKQELISKWSSLPVPLENIDCHISKLLKANPALLDFSKWGVYLPENYQVKLIKDKYFDIVETKEFLYKMRLVENL